MSQSISRGPLPVRMMLPGCGSPWVMTWCAGAVAVAPVADEHGWRLGRLVDPFGHEWEIGRPLGTWPPG